LSMIKACNSWPCNESLLYSGAQRLRQGGGLYHGHSRFPSGGAGLRQGLAAVGAVEPLLINIVRNRLGQEVAGVLPHIQQGPQSGG